MSGHTPWREIKHRRGTAKPGPSEDYRALLRGEITSEEYIRRLQALVDERMQVDRLYRKSVGSPDRKRRRRLLRRLTRLSQALPGGYR